MSAPRPPGRVGAPQRARPDETSGKGADRSGSLSPVFQSDAATVGRLSLRNLTLSPVSDDAEAFASWPQGKLYACGGRLALVYNAGRGHIADDLAVCRRESCDGGASWGERSVVWRADGWRGGATAWAAGVDHASREHMIVRLRGRSYHPCAHPDDRNGTRHLHLSRSPGAAWRVRDVPQLSGPHAAVMYHDMVPEPSGGFYSFWHSVNPGDVGIVLFNDARIAHRRLSGLPDGRFCEATAVLKPDGALTGFLRAEDPSARPLIWELPSGSDHVSFCASAEAFPAKSPIPVVRRDGLVFACSCERWGDAALRLHVAEFGVDGPPRTWESVELLRLDCALAGPTGSGVPAMTLMDDRLAIAFAHQSPDSGRCAVYCLSADIEVETS